MPTEQKCPQCGTPLTANALGGLCPACLLAQGVTADTATHGEATPFQPPTVEEVARLFPQLQVLEFIGKGGMGAVYKARQPALDRIIALKILPPQAAKGPDFAERFNREARALAKLSHPNIVAVHEFGQVDGMPFFIMEFVDGLNLRQLERAGRLAPREALEIVPQICEALQFAHDEGIVHRDIKPENILLDKKGRVKIADFGIAKIMGAAAGEAGVVSGQERPVIPGLTEQAIGTPNYMAPEQKTEPQSVDHRADIFSLGVVFYEMLTGELPVGKFAPPSRRVEVDVRLDEVVLRALEKEPEHRFQRANQVKTAVETIAASSIRVSTPSAASSNRGFDLNYRSEATLFGLPLLHIATGVDPDTGRPRVAKGFVAIGGVAKGVFAFGGVAIGIVAFGGAAIGGLAFGGGALGLIALGGGAVGLLAYGGLAIALIAALGGGALAPIAIGGGAIGYYAFGGGALGAHVLNAMTKDPDAQRFFLPWAENLMRHFHLINAVVVIFAMIIGIGVPFCAYAWVHYRKLRENGPGTPSANVMPLGAIALFLAIMSGAMGTIALCLRHPPLVLDWAILLSALGGIILAIPARKSMLGRSALVVGGVNLAIALILTVTFFSVNLRNQPKATAFGPVIEKIIAVDNLSNSFFKVDTGEFIPGPTDFDPAKPGEATTQNLQAWLTAHNVDLFARRENGKPMLAMSDMVIAVIDESDFDRLKDSRELQNNAMWRSVIDAQNRPLTQSILRGAYGGKATAVFQTRYDRVGILQVIRVVSDPPGVVVRYKLAPEANTNQLEQTSSPAGTTSEEKWSPPGLGRAKLPDRLEKALKDISAPDPATKPDPSKILDEAKQLAAEGKYEEALQRHIWYHNHALEYNPGLTGVRISFALAQWIELGRRYPKARQALIEIRDADTAKFATNGGYFQLFMDVQAINGYLQNDDATLDLFKEIVKRDPALARQCYFAAEDLLVKRGEYQLCLENMGSSQSRFNLIKQAWTMRSNVGGRLQEVSSNAFVRETTELVEILLGTGQTNEAIRVRDEAVSMSDNPRLKSAIEDAQERIKTKLAQKDSDKAAGLPSASAGKQPKPGEALAFGPVMERVIEETAAPDYKWFDLDTGNSFASGPVFPDINNVDDAAVNAWRRKTGAEISVSLAINTPRLFAFDTHIFSVDNTNWDQLSPQQLEALLATVKAPEAGTPISVDASVTTVCVFRTREGGEGILKVIGLSSNPPGVKIRYKMVKSGSAK